MSSATPINEADSGRVRQRLGQDLASLQAELEQLQESETLLRRISSRCCIALDGRDPATDPVVERLRQALRKPAEPGTLRTLLNELTTAVEQMDELAAPAGNATVSPPAPPTEALALPRVLKDLLESIEFDTALQPRVAELALQLDRWAPDGDWGALIRSIAELVNVQSHGLQDSLLRFEQVFGRINHRLAEMFEHVAQDAMAFESAQHSGRTLEQQLLGEVTNLGDEVRRSSDLPSLQQQVERRLARIEDYMQEFRAREQDQSAVFQQRAEAMREKITELEKQATSLQRAMRQQKRKALIDPVTGIANRSAYLRQAEAFVQRAQRSGQPLCVAIWDIDYFKKVNDTYGHRAGDRALRLVGRQLAEGVRRSDFVARFGGEEFVMLLENMDLGQATPVLEGLRKTIAASPFHHKGEPVKLTISCGVSQLDASGDLDAAFERADAALYESKRSGRNRISLG